MSYPANGALGPLSALIAPDNAFLSPALRAAAPAGGVTVSYFEWVQDLSRLFWDREEIRARLADTLGDAFERVWDLAVRDGISLRNAALVTGIREVALALEARGIYP